MDELTQENVIEKLKLVEDPDLFLNIWFLGLIYGIVIDQESRTVTLDMTFTTPLCPSGPQLVSDVKRRVGELNGVKEVTVNLVFSPPWQPSDEVKGLLGML